MRILRNLTLALFAATLVAATLPARADAGVFIGISVGYAPPPLPVYYQPPPPAPDWLWQPGYWAWGPYGYYWVPGTWVEPPDVGFLWTPGYWGFDDGFYRWNQGFWATQVGFYGGINYGFGYFGHGYDGGGWQGRHFRYNTAVTTVNTTIVRNVYYDRTVVNNYNNNSTRVSYQGGRGVRAYPTATERSVALDRHIGMTSQQQAHVMVAQRNRNQLASVNRGDPSTTTAARPFTQSSRPANFAPVRANDRVTNARVAPAYHAPQPAYHAPQIVNHASQPAYHAPQAVNHASQPAYHAPQIVNHASQPAYHAPQPAYHAPQIVNHASQPAYHAPQPAYHAQQPAYHQPVTSHQSAYHQTQSKPAPRQQSAPRPRPSHVPHG